MSLPCKRHSDGSEKVFEEEKARGCLMKIVDYKQKYALLEDGECGSQKRRIIKKEDYSDESHFLMHEGGLEVLLVAIKRYCQNVGLVELGHDVRVTGSPANPARKKLRMALFTYGVLLQTKNHLFLHQQTTPLLLLRTLKLLQILLSTLLRKIQTEQRKF